MTHHPSFPCTLGVDYTGGTSYVTIAQVRDIEGPGLSRNSIDVPPHHNLANNFVRKFAGVSEAGEITFPITLDWNAASHIGPTGLSGCFEDTYNGTSLPRWRYQNSGIVGGTATWVARGFVTAMPFNTGAVEGFSDVDAITIQIDGKPTLTIS